ncbi:DUF523 domain-containing protein [Gymnodinialimonas ceratoperidinii]|uniref:DUF523 domain-containing protein n=1 Tax=Gymnodinialimonas ceratoperidinii TaxID=2856823 RepID=A0A8F6YAI7_9RHOB|nr:DUF523 domain-containing protein [Gymnodinialimonas ceratoperidinii]QXT39608.1 DUF523 domain-containing protein [Gymnodinialimonas ceratoperidinii]
MEKILVSSCLMGAPVRYDGRAKTLENQLLATWRAEGRLVTLCPEMAAGLPTPRPPVEIAPGADAETVLGGRAGVYDKDGLDWTGEFALGAQLAVDLVLEQQCRFALLTDGSPSCGSTFVYSGHFDGQRQPGEGLVAHRLRKMGVSVFAPDQLRELADAVEEAENTAS